MVTSHDILYDLTYSASSPAPVRRFLQQPWMVHRRGEKLVWDPVPCRNLGGVLRYMNERFPDIFPIGGKTEENLLWRMLQGSFRGGVANQLWYGATTWKLFLNATVELAEDINQTTLWQHFAFRGLVNHTSYEEFAGQTLNPGQRSGLVMGSIDV